jgi:PBP1b-binding outer membrane lipoprotein LpoB
MKNKWIIILVAIAAVFAGCNGNANGSVESKSDTAVDTIGKHSPYGTDTLNKKRMDSVINKNDSLH